RGEASATKDYSAYAPGLDGVCTELDAEVWRAVNGKGSLCLWQASVDRGIGFSKTVQGYVEPLRCAGTLTIEKPRRRLRNRFESDPQVINTSRKSYVGELLS
ncbi:hypothetical protein BU17DRAFT_20619, partial [Hysterangium stoloniferum]